MAQIIPLHDSEILDMPTFSSRTPEVGDCLIFTGKIMKSIYGDRPLFEDLHTGDLVNISIGLLLSANGTIRDFIHNFDNVGEVLKVAYKAKVSFTVVAERFGKKTLPNGSTVNFRRLTINCEN